MKSKVNRGVTLVEVLATITISGILFAIIGTIIGTFNISYERSKTIRKMDNEIQYIENAISLCVEYSNINGYEFYIEKDDETIEIINIIDEEHKTLLTYDIVNKKIDLALSNSVKELEYIKSIDINIQDASKTGIMVEIITIEDVKKQSYHSVFNLR